MIAAENERKIFEKWYPRDWQADPAVRRCSLAARGLWIEMINLMIQSPRRGYLLDDRKKAYTPENLAFFLFRPVDEISKAMEELKENKVYSVDSHGVIFSRRLKRGEIRRKMAVETGKLGGNPTLIKQGLNGRPLRDRITGGLNPVTISQEPRARKERGVEGSDGLFARQASQAEASPKRPWTEDEKRNFAHAKVAAAIGQHGWEVVAAAADGDKIAIQTCRAVAKRISVTWYHGKPKVGAAK